MRHHFSTRHPSAQLEFIGVQGMFIQCSHCGTLVLPHTLPYHAASQFCSIQSARRKRHFDNLRRNRDAAFRFYIVGQQVETVRNFRYLGRILCDDDVDTLAIQARLQKARKTWGRFHSLLQSDGASPETMGRFYRTVIQQTLLFGSETWVLPRQTRLRLERFHRRCAWSMPRRPFRRYPDGTWDHPPTDEVLAECKLHSLAEYMER